MSTDYRLETPITKEELMSAVADIGVTEDVNADSDDERFCITDGTSYIWCYMNEDGKVEGFTRLGQNYQAREFIYHAADKLGINVYCEEDDEYWDDDGVEGHTV